MDDGVKRWGHLSRNNSLLNLKWFTDEIWDLDATIGVEAEEMPLDEENWNSKIPCSQATILNEGINVDITITKNLVKKLVIVSSYSFRC